MSKKSGSNADEYVHGETLLLQDTRPTMIQLLPQNWAASSAFCRSRELPRKAFRSSKKLLTYAVSVGCICLISPSNLAGYEWGGRRQGLNTNMWEGLYLLSAM